MWRDYRFGGDDGEDRVVVADVQSRVLANIPRPILLVVDSLRVHLGLVILFGHPSNWRLSIDGGVWSNASTATTCNSWARVASES